MYIGHNTCNQYTYWLYVLFTGYMYLCVYDYTGFLVAN